ncbi:MAG: glycosyltransferase [Desulfobulbaceae bacterium]|nr:glycosyltransferase [Desulfobulbaceae bacterium]
MTSLLETYAAITGNDVIDHLRQLAKPLANMKIVHVNSTRVGGGVAEILEKLVPLTNELGINAKWEIISGEADFYECTKSMHNALQGNRENISPELLQSYEQTNIANAEKLRPVLEEADFVFIHDPQPAALINHCPNRHGKWIWRCHIDASHPYRPVWKYLQKIVSHYDASIFSLPAFAQPLQHPQYIIPPSIDPLSDKNIDLPPEELSQVYRDFNLDPDRHLIVQVSRYDRFKDPVGVIRAYRLAKRFVPDLQLVLAGGSAADDPEGEIVVREVREAAGSDPDIHVLLLPPDAHRTINALQRAADIVLQKSTKEGFGLTVTEAMWKSKPVIGGDTGGIRLQVVNYHTGFLVHTPEGAALRIRYLLHQQEMRAQIGERAKNYVRENFLLTRHLREHLTLLVGLHYESRYRIKLS